MKDDERGLSLALEIVSLSKLMGYEVPMKTEFYIWFTGVLSEGPKEYGVDFSFNSIADITRKDWQVAKKYIYDSFEFRS